MIVLPREIHVFTVSAGEGVVGGCVTTVCMLLNQFLQHSLVLFFCSSGFTRMHSYSRFHALNEHMFSHIKQRRK